MVIINIIGGLAVLGSYAWGLLGFPETRGGIWGGIPESMKPFYTYSMLTAAAGYFLFTPFFLFRVDPQKLDQSGPFSFSIINWLYLLVLIPSALWLPLTFELLQAPSDFLWLLVRLVLAITALGSLGLLYAIVRLRSHAGAVGFWLALLGILAFNLQTTLLDALVWTSYFPYPNPM
ncbi:MAG: hypothetical protein CL917_14465 [Deltaproteobacteria bacterium]|nr:hypothetical protein [Deltaproteobacteria bacterium]